MFSVRLSSRQREALEDASRDRLQFVNLCEMRLFAAGTNYSILAEDTAYGGADPETGSPGVVLTTKINAKLPDDVIYEPCRVEWYVMGELIVGYEGQLVEAVEEGGVTSITAATSGTNLDATDLGDGPADDIEYASARPDSVLYQALALCGYRGIELPPVNTPLITRQGNEKFRWTDKASDVAQEVRNEANLCVMDSPLNIAGGFVIGSSSEKEPVWEFIEGRDFDFGDLEVEDRGAGDDEGSGRYAEIWVVQEQPDGSRILLAKAGVDNGERKVRKGSRLTVTYEASDTEGARQKAMRLARKYSVREKQLKFPVVYPAFFLERGDDVWVTSREIEPGGTRVITETRYRGRIHAINTTEFAGELTVVATQVSQVRVEREEPEEETSAGVLRCVVGYDYMGRLYFERSLPWVYFDSDRGLVIDVDAAAAAGISVTFDPTKGIRVG